MPEGKVTVVGASIRVEKVNLCGSSLSSATAAEVAEAIGISPARASEALEALEREGHVVLDAGGREGGRLLTDRWRLVSQEQPRGSRERLGRGQLGDLVIDHLRDHPGEVSPSQLAKKLGRSAGAISNVLVKLAGTADLVETSDHPRRYTWRSRRGAPVRPTVRELRVDADQLRV